MHRDKTLFLAPLLLVRKLSGQAPSQANCWQMWDKEPVITNQLPSLSKRRDAIKALSITQNVTSVYCSCFTQKELYLVSYTSCCYGTLTFGEGKHAWEILGEEDTGRKRNVSVVEPGCGKRCGMGFWGFGVSTARINCWKNCAVLRKKKHVRREKKKNNIECNQKPTEILIREFYSG